MSLIQITNLTFAYPGSWDTVFQDVTLSIDTSWRLGLIGRNGRGKTTLLRLLMGELPYSGSIRTGDVSFFYFPTPVPDPSRMTLDILAGLCPAEDWELIRELSLLDVDCEVLYRPFSTLSPGEQTKCLLAALFQNPGHYLLIDEPTNHLDAQARRTLAAYLKGKKGFLLVSHDRDFLDGCTDHILSINRCDLSLESGNFSSWWENQRRQEAYEEATRTRLKKDIRRLTEASRRTAAWSMQTEKGKFAANTPSGSKPDRGYVGHKAAKLMKRSKAIEARRQEAAQEKASLLKNQEQAVPLKLYPLEYRGNLLLDMRGLSITYNEKPVFAPLSLSLRPGERVALTGRNGSGKSSLLKLLTGEPLRYSGELNIPARLVCSYVPQDTSRLQGGIAAFAEAWEIPESLFKSVLRSLGFDRVQLDKDMAALSEGQKKKILIARSLCQRAHLYLWDEPLNYVDIYSRMQIEALILSFSPTMLFVEHDAAFCRRLATRTAALERPQGGPPSP